MLNSRPVALFVVSLTLLFVTIELGYRLQRLGNVNDEKRHEQLKSTRDQITWLLSLLLGFTLAMAMTRFDRRVQLIVDEANAIGTTFLRADLLPEPARTKARSLLVDYVSARVEFSKEGLEARGALARTKDLQSELWRLAASAAQQSPTPVTALFVNSLNETIDLHATRIAALENRIPRPVWVMLGLLALLTALMFGLSQRERLPTSMLVPPLMLAVVLSLIADLDTPRTGLIRVDMKSIERLQVDVQAP